MAQHHFVRSPLVLVTLIVVPLFILGFLGVLYVQQQNISALNARTLSLQGQIVTLQEQNAFYRDAYHSTLDDLRTLSKVYGGQSQFDTLANGLREQELSMVLGNASVQSYVVRNPGLWSEYSANGVVVSSCVDQSSVLTTDTGRFTLSVNTTVPLDVRVYVDGNFLVNFTADSLSWRSFDVSVPSGRHELSLVVPSGVVGVEQLYVDTAAMPVSLLTSNPGSSWSSFDCVNATRSPIVVGPGALRLGFVAP